MKSSDLTSQFKVKITDLENKVNVHENEIQLLKKHIRDNSKFKIESFSDLKKEFKAFFSRNGHSAILETNSIIKKVFWLSCMIALFVSGIYLACKNVQGYQANDVITQIRVIDVDLLMFPAITLCLAEFTFKDENNSNDFTVKGLDLRSAITALHFENKNLSNLNDLEYILMYTGPNYNSYIAC